MTFPVSAIQKLESQDFTGQSSSDGSAVSSSYIVIFFTCDKKEEEYILIEDTGKTVVRQDLVRQHQAGQGEGQAGQEEQAVHHAAGDGRMEHQVGLRPIIQD